MRVAALVFTVALAACSREPSASRAASAVVSSALSARAQGELVLDLSDRGDALVGSPLRGPTDGDGDRLMRVRTLRASIANRAVPDGETVIDARFVPRSEGVMVLGGDHVLRLVIAGRGATEIDQSVVGPLSFDALGRFVVYVRGEVPDLQVVRTEIATGAHELMAPGLMPAWCPALSADGTEVVFVASHEGAIGYWKTRAGSAPVRWRVEREEVFPTGPSAPRVFGDALVFENETGVHARGLDGALRKSFSGLHQLSGSSGGTALIAHRADGSLMTLTARELAGTP